jgi:predicted PurR-regulated permease PerM
MLRDLSKELDKPKEVAPSLGSSTVINPRTSGSSPATPVPVEVRQPDPGALESLKALISPLLHPLATTGIIIIFVIFILLQRENLRNRLIRLAGSHDLQRTTAALDDAASRLSRLFLSSIWHIVSPHLTADDREEDVAFPFPKTKDRLENS